MFIPIPFHAKRTPAVDRVIDRIEHLYPERRHGRQHIRDLCLLVDARPQLVIRALLCLGWKPPAHKLENGWWEAPPATVPPHVRRILDSLGPRQPALGPVAERRQPSERLTAADDPDTAA